jgi:hypothetical protein
MSRSSEWLLPFRFRTKTSYPPKIPSKSMALCNIS